MFDLGAWVGKNLVQTRGNYLRGHVQMTSVLSGGRGGSQILTIGGGGCVIPILEILTGGGGVKNPEN